MIFYVHSSWFHLMLKLARNFIHGFCLATKRIEHCKYFLVIATSCSLKNARWSFVNLVFRVCWNDRYRNHLFNSWQCIILLCSYRISMRSSFKKGRSLKTCAQEKDQLSDSNCHAFKYQGCWLLTLQRTNTSSHGFDCYNAGC